MKESRLCGVPEEDWLSCGTQRGAGGVREMPPDRSAMGGGRETPSPMPAAVERPDGTCVTQ